MNKRQLLETVDLRRLVKGGVVSCSVLIRMEIYDTYRSKRAQSREAANEVAGLYGVDVSTVHKAVREMEREVPD